MPFTLDPSRLQLDTSRLQTDAAARLYSTLAPAREQARIDAAMWGLDARWALKGKWIDSRVCLTTPPQPYTSACGGDPICTWGMYTVDVPCNNAAFGGVLFQEQRYIWAQRKLVHLLSTKPEGRNGFLHAEAWTDWCMEVMRVVSVARASTNITTTWMPAFPRMRRALSTMAALKLATNYPVGRHPEGGYQVPSMWMPRDLNNVDALDVSAPGVALTRLQFDPRVQVQNREGAAVVAGGVVYPWPHGYGAMPNTVRKQMLVWFGRTLGKGRWISAPTSIRYVTTQDCGFSFAASNACVKEANSSVEYGGADSTIALCEAMAQDVIEMSFGKLVSAGLTSWLDAYAAIPPELRILSDTDITAAKEALIGASVEESMVAFSTGAGILAAVAGAINAAAGVVVAVFAAVVALIVEILRAAGAMAFGGGVLEQACLVTPVVRSVAVGGEGGAACNFNVRDTGTYGVLARLEVVKAFAAEELPVDAWYEASKRVSTPGGGVEELVRGPNLPPPPGAEESSWVSWALGAAAVVGGALIIKKIRE